MVEETVYSNKPKVSRVRFMERANITYSHNINKDKKINCKIIHKAFGLTLTYCKIQFKNILVRL